MAFSKYLFTSTLVLGTLCFTSAYSYGSVRSPYVTKDELAVELESKRSSDDGKKFNNAQSHSVEFGYGVTDHLKLELEGEWQRKSGEDLFFDTGSIAGRYALAKRGEHFIDTALYGAYDWTADDNDPQSVTAGLLVQKQWGRIIHRANLFLEREVGDDREGGVALETRYLAMLDYDNAFRPGIEWQAEWGQSNDIKEWNDQGQHLGPAIYGKLPLAQWEGHGLNYEVSHLFGISNNAPDHASRIKLEYTLQF